MLYFKKSTAQPLKMEQMQNSILYVQNVFLCSQTKKQMLKDKVKLAEEAW